MFSVILVFVFLVCYTEAGIQTSGSVMIVKRVKSLKCRSVVNLSHYPGQMVAYHQWNQVYGGEMNHTITNLQPIKAVNTDFTVELEKFDNSSDMYSVFSVYNASNGFQHVFTTTIHCSGSEKKLISLFDDNYYQNKFDNALIYVGSKNIKISCQEYSLLSKNVQIGWIDAVGTRIYTYNETETTFHMTDAHNGSTLCCIYYTITADKNGMKIQRFVKNKTLMIYQKEIANTPSTCNQPSSTTTVKYCEKTDIPENSNATRVVSYISNGTGKNSGNINENEQILGSFNDTIRNSGTSSETGRNSGTSSETVRNSGTSSETGGNSGTSSETGRNTGTSSETGRNSGTSSETGENSGTSSETGRNSGTSSETVRNTGTTTEIVQKTHVKNETSKGSGTTSRTDPSDLAADYHITIIVSSISAILVVLIVGISAVKKRCWKKPNRPVRPQLPVPQSPNEPDSNSPFYLNLLFRKECEQEIQAQEEPPYEEIIYISN